MPRPSTAKLVKVDFRKPRLETSRRMAVIKQRETAPEMTIRRGLHATGLRFRTHVTSLPGRPDLVFPRYRTVLMVHGCFWHQHQKCSRATIPRTNRRYWRAKLVGNTKRDKLNASRLRRLGWRVFVVWECQLSPSRVLRTVERLSQRIRKVKLQPRIG